MNDRPRRRSSNSTKSFGGWGCYTMPSVTVRMVDMVDSKAWCRNHSDPYNDCYLNEYENNDEFEVNVPSKTYDSVYLSDYINDTTISSSDPEMDSDLQCAIMSSLESSHCSSPSKLDELKELKKSKESKSKKSRKSRGKNKENSFENYWNQCMEFNKSLKKKKERKSKEKKQESNETEQESYGKSRISKLLREYMRLCHQSQGKNLSHKHKGRNSFFGGGMNPFSVGSIYSKLNSIAPSMTFEITPLANARSTDPDALAFHGTPSQNVESIKSRGLVVGGTNGVAISNGAAYGNGVYCSPSLQFASGYSGGAIFVCEVSTSHSVKRCGNVWVVPQSQMIKPVLLIEYNGGYLSERSVSRMGSKSVCVFIPSIGPLNTPCKHRRKRKRFSNRPDGKI